MGCKNMGRSLGAEHGAGGTSGTAVPELLCQDLGQGSVGWHRRAAGCIKAGLKLLAEPAANLAWF